MKILKTTNKAFTVTIIILTLFIARLAIADNTPSFYTPAAAFVDPIVMMRDGQPTGCGYNFVFALDEKPKPKFIVGSYSLQIFDFNKFSISGTFKIGMTDDENVGRVGFDKSKLKLTKIFSAWTKPKADTFEITSKYLKNIHEKDIDPYYLGATGDATRAFQILEVWDALTAGGGQIGYNTTGHGFDSVINIPEGLLASVANYQSTNKTVMECLVIFSKELKAQIDK